MGKMEKKMINIVAKMREEGFYLAGWDDGLPDDSFLQCGFVTGILKSLGVLTIVHFSLTGGETVVTIIKCNQWPKKGDIKTEIWSSERDNYTECPLSWVLKSY